jgi:MOSC domain-containing protein YiiM
MVEGCDFPISNLIGKTGVMAIVITAGDVKAGDMIAVELPAGKQCLLLPV